MAKGDDLYKGGPNNQINNNALMGRGGMESMQGIASQPFGGGGMGQNLLQSLMPFLAQMQQQGGMQQGNTGIQPGSPANNAIKGAGAIPSAIQRLKGNKQSFDFNQLNPNRSSMGGGPPVNPFEQGRGRAMGAVNAAANRFNPPPMSGGMGGNETLPNQSANQFDTPMLQRPGFLSSLMGGNVPMRGMM